MPKIGFAITLSDTRFENCCKRQYVSYILASYVPLPSSNLLSDTNLLFFSVASYILKITRPRPCGLGVRLIALFALKKRLIVRSDLIYRVPRNVRHALANYYKCV